MYTQYSPKDKMDFGYYLIAYIDILGQRESLQKFKKLPEAEDEKQEFQKTLKATFGTVDAIRRIFDAFFEAQSKKGEYPGPMTEEQRKLFDELREFEVKFQRFADTIVMYLPLQSRKGHRLPVQGVFTVLMACASAFLATLAGKHVLRGSIEVGLAAEMCEGEIYGPALFEAYRLESNVAQYPRIVIGDQLIQYLRETATAEGTDIVSQINRESAKTCLAFVFQDIDGHYILDYMGEGVRRIMPPEGRIKEVGMAKAFLFEQARKWKNEKNTKLAARYALMAGYFLSRLPLWEEPSP